MFFWLVALAANQLGVFIALKIAQTYDHWIWRKRGGDGGHAFGQAIHIKIDRAGIALNTRINLGFDRCVLLIVFQQCFWVHANVAIDNHFKARQTHAGIGQLTKFKRAFWVRDIHHNLERRRWHITQIRGQALKLQCACVNIAGVALGAGHSDLLPGGDF